MNDVGLSPLASMTKEIITVCGKNGENKTNLPQYTPYSVHYAQQDQNSGKEIIEQ